jgi:hypothetical protein
LWNFVVRSLSIFLLLLGKNVMNSLSR